MFFGYVKMGETTWYDVFVVCGVWFGLVCTCFCVAFREDVLPLFIGSNFVYMDPVEKRGDDIGESDQKGDDDDKVGDDDNKNDDSGSKKED